MKKLMLSLVLLSSVSACKGDEQASEEYKCLYEKDFVKEEKIENKNIASSYWIVEVQGYEEVKRLYLIYKNGDIAVVEHKYCSMYNFNIDYFISNWQRETPENISKVLDDLWSHSKLKPTVSKTFSSILESSLKAVDFDGEKSQFIPLLEELQYKNDSTDYQFHFSKESKSPLYPSSVNFYYGVGG